MSEIKAELDALEDRIKRHVTDTVKSAEAIWTWAWIHQRSGTVLNVAAIALILYVAFRL